MSVIQRTEHLRRLRSLMRQFPVVGILGARQVGKTTLARQLVDAHRGPVTYFDLESAEDLARLADPMLALRRFWMMLARYHGQVWNASELARSFGVAHTTVQRYLDLLSATFMIRQLPAWHENIGKPAFSRATSPA